MNVLHPSPARKATRTTRQTFDAESAMNPAIRFILTRFDMSPSLAGTIASLAQIGGRT